MITETNYEKMDALGLLKLSTLGEHTKIESSGFMPLSLKIIDETSEYYELSMAHYSEQNGDLMRDPEMIIRIYPELKECTATYYRNDFLGSEQFVSSNPNVMIDIRLKRELNSFLRTWLINLKRQGFSL